MSAKPRAQQGAEVLTVVPLLFVIASLPIAPLNPLTQLGARAMPETVGEHTARTVRPRVDVRVASTSETVWKQTVAQHNSLVGVVVEANPDIFLPASEHRVRVHQVVAGVPARYITGSSHHTLSAAVLVQLVPPDLHLVEYRLYGHFTYGGFCVHEKRKFLESQKRPRENTEMLERS